MAVSLYLVLKGTLAPLALGGAFVVVFLAVCVTEIHRASQTYEVNPFSVIHTIGIFSRHSKRIDLLAINSVGVTKSFYQRLLNIGDIHVHVANASHQTVLRNLHAPNTFAQIIEQNLQKARKGNNKTSDEPDENTRTLIQTPKKQQTQKNGRETDAEILERLQEV